MVFFCIIRSIEVLMSIRIIYKDCLTGDIFEIESRACPVFGKILLLSVKWVSLDDPPLITVIPTQVFKQGLLIGFFSGLVFSTTNYIFQLRVTILRGFFNECLEVFPSNHLSLILIKTFVCFIPQPIHCFDEFFVESRLIGKKIVWVSCSCC